MHADLGDGHGPDRPSQRVGQQLVPEADAEAGPPQLADPAADGRLLVDQPGVHLLLPDVLGPAHDHQQVEGVEVGDGLAVHRAPRCPARTRRLREGSERAGILVWVVLEDEDPVPLSGSRGGGAHAIERGHGRMSRYSLTSQSVTVPMKRSHSSRL